MTVTTYRTVHLACCFSSVLKGTILFRNIPQNTPPIRRLRWYALRNHEPSKTAKIHKYRLNFNNIDGRVECPNQYIPLSNVLMMSSLSTTTTNHYLNCLLTLLLTQGPFVGFSVADSCYSCICSC